MTQPKRQKRAVSGWLGLDKPYDMTSTQAVGKVRWLFGAEKAGHAGTLDPLATGILPIALGEATKTVPAVQDGNKVYRFTVQWGAATTTDDAEGEITGTAAAEGVTVEAIDTAVATLTGEILQVPPAVSAIKVGGQRAYKLTRAGAAPELKARPVTVYEFTVTDVRPDGDLLDFDATVRCSSGTYIRALARDLGATLGSGGHLTRLRRTRVGGYRIEDARTLEQLAGRFEVLPLAQAAAAAFPSRTLTEDEARRLAHGGRLSPTGVDEPTAAYAPDGTLIALVTEESGQARPLVVFA